MDDRTTISTFQLFKMFPDNESARVYLEARLWPSGPRCPVCAGLDRITTRKEGYYRCNKCAEDFTVRTGTVMERSHVPLHKWLYAMYLLVTARKGISSLQLSKEIGITQKSAWFVLGRLREACGQAPHHLQGTDRMKPPKELDRIADKVLAYRVPARTKKAKKRARKRRKVQRESCI